MALLELVQQVEHARAAFGGVVEPDMELRDAAETEPRAELAPDEHHRPVERRERRLPLRLVADHADPDAGMAEIRCGLDLGHGHEADSGIRHLAAQDLADLLSQQLIDPLSALGHRATRWSRSWLGVTRLRRDSRSGS